MDEKQAVKTAQRVSSTVALLEVSLTTYTEIKKLLEKAGYDHKIDEAEDTIDLTGLEISFPKHIGVDVTVFINGTSHALRSEDGFVTYDMVYEVVYGKMKPAGHFPTATWKSKNPTRAGLLNPDDRVHLEPYMRFNMMDTVSA